LKKILKLSNYRIK